MKAPPSAEFAKYLPHIRRRWQREQADLARRRERAQQVARRAVEVLRGQFGARQVILFGSLARDGSFDERSDIDVAVSGIPAREFFRASAAVAAGSEFQVDLVDLADCSLSLRESIEREGVHL